jgi:sporulation protein YlmC with PRC-barrel domain
VGATIEREVEEVVPEVEVTPEMTATLEIPATPEVAGTAEVTATAAITGTMEAEATPEETAAIEATPEITATMEITGTPGVAGTPAITATVETIVATAEAEATPNETPAAALTPEMMPTAERTGTPVAAAPGEGELEVQLPTSVRLSALLDYTIRNPEGENLGDLEDLMINWREGQVAYAVLSFGEFLGMGGKWFAIPLTALTLNPVEQTVVIDIEPEMLDAAPGFDQANWPETADLDWDEEIRQYWEARQQELQQPVMETPAGEMITPAAEEATPAVETTPQAEAPPAETTPEGEATATPSS